MKTLVILILFSALFILPGYSSSYGPNGIAIHFTQPNGTTVDLFVKGDQYYARTVTKDGYTVIYDAKNKRYVYATLSKGEDAFLLTDLVVGIDSPAHLKKNIKLNKKVRKAIWEKNANRNGIERRNKIWQAKVRKAQIKRLKVIDPQAASTLEQEAARDNSVSPAEFANINGNVKGLTILVQFPDDPNTPEADPKNFPTTTEKINRYCNELGYHDDGNSGSIRDYYRDQSNNLLDYTNLITTIVTLPHPRNYYNYSDYPTNKTLYQNIRTVGNMLIKDAITILKNNNFNFNGLSIKNNDSITTTNLLFAGPPSANWAKGLWPHRSAVDWHTVDVTVDGTKRYLRDYQITNILNATPVIGTFAHENGHMLLGYPDLYDYGHESSGLGYHGLMAAGNHNNGGKTPAPINIYFKDIVGWANITELSSTDFLSKDLPTTGNVGVRITNPNNAKEFFIIENKGAGDKWATFLPDKGIAIFHIDENVRGNNNQEMTESKHYEVSLEQSDGNFNLEHNDNRGDSTDYYDLASNLFTDATTPNAKWWNGTNSGIRIEVLANPGSSVLVNFGENPNITIFYPNGSETLIVNSTVDIKWTGVLTGNVKIDLYKNGAFYKNIVASTNNNGLYHWTIGEDIPVDSGYNIKVTGIENSSLNDMSNAVFSTLVEQFPKNLSIPKGWVMSSASNKDWTIDNTVHYEGGFSLKNGKIVDSQTSEIKVTSDFLEGNISFWAKVSSEKKYDGLYFYIDGVEKKLNSDSSYSSKFLSGEIDWVKFTFPVSSGSHTFKWAYKKDSSVTKGADTAWIDAVVLPPKPLSGIALWKANQFGSNAQNESIAGDNADPDKDGLSNFLEYALNLDPQKPSSTGIIATITGSTLSITYPRNKEANDLDFSIEGSTDMIHWNSVKVTKSLLGTNGDTEKIKAVLNDSVTNRRYFLRVKINYKQ